MTGGPRLEVYIEVGQRRTFAGAIDWPGWCRSGRDEAAALETLYQAAPRYARVLRSARLGFPTAIERAELVVTQHLQGNASTEFGAPDRAPAGDDGRVPKSQVRRLEAILKASWRAFDAARAAGTGKTLRKGPRRGGRELDEIARHVLEAEAAYLGRLGEKYQIGDGDASEELRRVHKVILQAFAAAAPHGTPAPGPRGGARWSPRYFVRRVAWHVLDHAWEIEDRAA